MPFTFSHPSLFLPLTKVQQKWFSLTTLIIGSMIPDFEYFIRMRIQSDYSHTFLGVFWFDLPLTILVAFLFHNVIRNSLYDNLPYALQDRLKTFNKFRWNDYFSKNWLVVIVSALIGIFSHLLWDSFTHDGAYFVERIPTLQNSFLSVPVYKILQHGSSLVGMLVTLFVLWRLPIQVVERTRISVYYWLLFVLIVVVIVVVRLLLGLNYKQYGHVIVTIISGSLIALVITPIVTKVFCYRGR